MAVFRLVNLTVAVEINTFLIVTITKTSNS